MTAWAELARREAAGRRILADLRRRAALDEAVGILSVWGACGNGQARDGLRAVYGRGGEAEEAARVIAVVDADADGRADPDWT